MQSNNDTLARMMKTKRKSVHEARAKELTAVALRMAQEHGLNNITRDQIAKEAGVASGLVSLRLGTMPAMRRTVMRAAVAQGVLEVIAEGLAHRDPHALAAPLELRQKASAVLAGV